MKPKYLLPCSCGQQTPVEASQAGQTIRCQCGATLEVPTMRGLAQLDRAGPESQVPGPLPAGTRKGASKAPTSHWGPRQGALLVGALIAALGFGFATHFYVTRPRIIEAASLSPLETWQLWFDLKQGIDQRPPWEEMYLRGIASYERWMIVVLTIAGIGVVVMAAALFIPRKRQTRRPDGTVP